MHSKMMGFGFSAGITGVEFRCTRCGVPADVCSSTCEEVVTFVPHGRCSILIPQVELPVYTYNTCAGRLQLRYTPV